MSLGDSPEHYISVFYEYFTLKVNRMEDLYLNLSVFMFPFIFCFDPKEIDVQSFKKFNILFTHSKLSFMHLKIFF